MQTRPAWMNCTALAARRKRMRTSPEGRSNPVRPDGEQITGAATMTRVQQDEHRGGMQAQDPWKMYRKNTG
jgi:hypothetical protein